MTKHFDLSELRRRAVIERDRRQRLSEQKAEAEDDLLAFIRMFWHCIEPTTVFVNGWVIEAIADALMAVSEGEITRLLINVAPGSMKSMMLNIAFPLWEWGPRNKPSERYISASYSSSLTERDNGRMLRILRDPIYQQCWPYVVVEREGLVKIENTATGWKLATSIGGTLTGMRAGKILLDDVNNPANVESAVVRAQTNLVVREVLPDRLENLKTGAIISIQQRTHEEDATGTLAKYGDSYEWLCIPTEFDPLRNFPLVLRRDDEGRAVDVWRDPRGLDENGDELEGTYTDDRGNLAVRMGSPMAQADGVLAWPERFPRKAIEEQKRIKGPYAFAGQYQQLPSARGGGMILRDWWQPWMSEEYPDLGTVIGSLDTAVEEGRNNDYNAFITFGAFGAPSGEPKLILTSAWRLRATLAELAARTAESCYRYKVDYLLIERRTRGKDLHDELLRLYAGAPWQTVLVEPTNSKADRLKSVAHLFSGDCRRDPVTGIDVYSGGMVYAPMKDWSDEVITEVANFPAAAHDDYCDAVSQAMIWVRKNGVALRKTEYEAEQTERRTYKRPARVPYAIARE